MEYWLDLLVDTILPTHLKRVQTCDCDTSTLTTRLQSQTKAQGWTCTDALDTQNLCHHGCPTTSMDPRLDLVMPVPVPAGTCLGSFMVSL